MNENLNTESIRQLLNRSSCRLQQPALARLRDLRTQALARYDEHVNAPVFAWTGAASTSLGHTVSPHRGHYYYYCAAAVLLAALLFTGTTYWQHVTEHDNSEVDIAILTDDLPIDAYVD